MVRMSIYMDRVRCFYHWLLLEDQSWQFKMNVICVVPQPTYGMNSKDQLEFASIAPDPRFCWKEIFGENDIARSAICIKLIYLLLWFKNLCFALALWVIFFYFEFHLEIGFYIMQDPVQKDSVDANLNFKTKIKLPNTCWKIKF